MVWRGENFVAVYCPVSCLAQCLADTQCKFAAVEELQALGWLYRLTLELSNWNYRKITPSPFFFFKTWQMHWTTHRNFGIKVYAWEKAICWFLVNIRTSSLDPMTECYKPSAQAQRLGKNRNLPFIKDKTTILHFHILLRVHFFLQGDSPGTLSPPLFSLFWGEAKVKVGGGGQRAEKRLT